MDVSEAGKLGGSKTSDKKTAAARRNGKKGGWKKGVPRTKDKERTADADELQTPTRSHT